MKPLSILTLTGWCQITEALDDVLPPGAQVTHFPYHNLPDLPAVFNALKALPMQPDAVVGWSLGGRIAAQAVAKRILTPKRFIQIASVFRFVPGSGLDNAAQKELYGFHNLFRQSPEQARQQLMDIIVSGDSRADEVRAVLRCDTAHDSEWQNWLISSRFGADGIDFSSMPRTLLIHGGNDRLVSLSHSLLYKEGIPHARLEVLHGCGHAPHLHAPEKIRALIAEELNSI